MFAFSSHFIIGAWRAVVSIKHLFDVCVDLLHDSAVFLVLSSLNLLFIVSVVDTGGVSSFVTCYVSSTCRPVLCSLVVSSQDIPLVQVLISFVRIVVKVVWRAGEVRSFLSLVPVGHAWHDVKDDFLVCCLRLQFLIKCFIIFVRSCIRIHDRRTEVRRWFLVVEFAVTVSL